jgi:hypothetical protein
VTRRLLGRLLSAVGLAVSLTGVAIQVGVALPGNPGPSGGPQPSIDALPAATVVPAAPTATPPASTATAGSALPTDPAPTSVVASQGVTVWFADQFGDPGRWPTGGQEYLTLGDDAGTYVVSNAATDLPLVVIAGTEGLEPALPFTVEVVLDFDPSGPASGAAGVVIGDGAGTRLLTLVGADGKVGLYRDNVESLDLLASGSVALVDGRATVAVAVSAEGAVVLVDGEQVARTSETLPAREFGLALWSWEAANTVRVEHYRIWSPR